MDKKNLIKKGLAVAVILLFVGVSAIPSTGSIIEKSTILTFYDGNTLYVGGDGHGNYTRIQDAIDNASDGDMVYVYNDSSPYYENLIVDKSISLIGEDRDTTIIDGNRSGVVIYIITNWVNISRFTIQYGGGIFLDSDRNNISDNIISDNERGILISYSSENTIMNNRISENKDGILLKRFSSNNIITGNYILGSFTGISIKGFSNSNNITGNNIDSNFWAGIEIMCSSGNTILGNNIFNNLMGLSLSTSNKNIIEKNNFIGNGIHAFFSVWFLAKNFWDSNYWDNWIGIGPKLILGSLGIIGIIPWVNFDWHPAREPYDIPKVAI